MLIMQSYFLCSVVESYEEETQATVHNNIYQLFLTLSLNLHFGTI